MCQKYHELFPAPSLPPSQLSPQRFPGANLESLAALQDVLKDNHERHHIFINHIRFHNHVTHRALAIYALGGPAKVIKNYYQYDSLNQRLAIEPPEPITERNFTDHLGDEDFYQGYVRFFSERASENGAASVLEEFVFSEKYNFENGKDEKVQPAMLARFFSGLMHPLIHVGHGVEFGLKGMLVEGLALTAVHHFEYLPLSSFALTPSKEVDLIGNRLLSLALEAPTTEVGSKTKTDCVHAFDIIASILEDNRFNLKEPENFVAKFVEILEAHFSLVNEHVEKWKVDPKVPGEIERKMEELIWVSSLIYAVGGSTPNGFKPDFFFMHLVTSSLFLPSLIAYLSPRSQVMLLRGYLLTVLTWWVARGRPTLDIKSFMTTTLAEPSGVAGPAPNPFLPLLQTSIAHPNDHFVKIQRSFAHFNTLYGTRPAGYFGSTKLVGAELLDGSLFLRAASLTVDGLGWVREGDEARPFSFEGFYE